MVRTVQEGIALRDLDVDKSWVEEGLKKGEIILEKGNILEMVNSPRYLEITRQNTATNASPQLMKLKPRKSFNNSSPSTQCLAVSISERTELLTPQPIVPNLSLERCIADSYEKDIRRQLGIFKRSSSLPQLPGSPVSNEDNPDVKQLREQMRQQGERIANSYLATKPQPKKNPWLKSAKRMFQRSLTSPDLKRNIEQNLYS